MSLNQTFTFRQIAEACGSKVVTLQSWADKGWAKVTPAPGPGQTRQLTVVDAYALSIAIAFEAIGVAPQKANDIARAAIYYGETGQRARERTFAELGETSDTYFFGSPERETRPGPIISLTLEDLDPAFRWRDPSDPYHLFVRAGGWREKPEVLPFINTNVDIMRIKAWAAENPEGLADELIGGALSNIGYFINLTDLLASVDSALAIQ